MSLFNIGASNQKNEIIILTGFFFKVAKKGIRFSLYRNNQQPHKNILCECFFNHNA